MRNVVLFDTSVATHNMGDYIISESINREMEDLICKDFIVRYPTHTPVRKLYQKIKKNNFVHNADFKFLCGTNLFGTNLFRPVPNFNINIFDTDIYSNSISLGCGIGKDHPDSTFNTYTRLIYKRILSKKYIHSVRDEETKNFLNELGVTAVNTGCPTLWSLSPESCNRIPKRKSNTVVFTFTDYNHDETADSRLLEILYQNYAKLYYWIQGSGDLSYMQRLAKRFNVELVYPALENYRKVLESNDIDYVGTRLHAGVYAMQKVRRAIILVVDNRAKDMGLSHNLPIVDRRDYDRIDNMINSEFETQVVVDFDVIREWKAQFR